MERVERTSLTPATSFLADALLSVRQFFAELFADHTPAYPWGVDIAFSDELERELIRQELHRR